MRREPLTGVGRGIRRQLMWADAGKAGESEGSSRWGPLGQGPGRDWLQGIK